MPSLDPAKHLDPPPVKPPEPDPGECCGEGCVRCVWDVHAEAMLRYEVALTAWCTRQSAGR